jgi:recombination associated protein RdgC
LPLTWNSRVSFVLTESQQFKKMAFLDVMFDNGGTGKDDGFDADTAIATGELCKRLPDRLVALGGKIAAA